ncbi:MAG: 50S ribosomal protein L3 [Candidatus Wildermuthbacteria bacterium]|nr:50S ribosomal protein L3 [Candidatus Wildermuthbacteria bacterium]
MKAVLGRKIGMTQIFQEADGKVVPVTLIEAGPCKVLQVKTLEKDGYQAVQLGFESITKENKKQKSANGKEFKVLGEFRSEGSQVLPNPQDSVDVTVFAEGDKVRVSGISKGKGFQGGVKRHGFSGRNATHGVKHEQRTIGSTGSRFPQHVVKGRRMPEHNILALKGAVPGNNGIILEIQGM